MSGFDQLSLSHVTPGMITYKLLSDAPTSPLQYNVIIVEKPSRDGGAANGPGPTGLQ